MMPKSRIKLPRHEKRWEGNRGENQFFSRLTADIVRSIRRDREGGMNTEDIMDKYNISQSYVYKLVNGKAWSHIE